MNIYIIIYLIIGFFGAFLCIYCDLKNKVDTNLFEILLIIILSCTLWPLFILILLDNYLFPENN